MFSQEFWKKTSEQLFCLTILSSCFCRFLLTSLEGFLEDTVKHLWRSFFAKIVVGWKPSTTFTKNLHHRCFDKALNTPLIEIIFACFKQTIIIRWPIYAMRGLYKSSIFVSFYVHKLEKSPFEEKLTNFWRFYISVLSILIAKDEQELKLRNH